VLPLVIRTRETIAWPKVTPTKDRPFSPGDKESTKRIVVRVEELQTGYIRQIDVRENRAETAHQRWSRSSGHKEVHIRNGTAITPLGLMPRFHAGLASQAKNRLIVVTTLHT
jgi:hypothetical protein